MRRPQCVGRNAADYEPTLSKRTRDVKTPKFYGPARPVVHFSGPARPIIKNFIFGQFGPVWASENVLSSMFYNKTTNYLVLTIGVPSIGAGESPGPPSFLKTCRRAPPVVLKNKRLLDGPLKLVTLLLETVIIHLYSIYL